MDEWTENSLSCEDAKRVLQGLLCTFNFLECSNEKWTGLKIHISLKKHFDLSQFPI